MGKKFKAMAQPLKGDREVILQETAMSDAIIESIADGIIVTDSRERVILVNRAAEALVGLSRDAIVGKPLGDYLKELCGGSDRPPRGEIRCVNRAGRERIYRLARSTMRDEKGRRLGRIVSLHDITAEKEVYKLKSEFVSNLSHELRTPLTTIKSYVSYMLEGKMGALEEKLRNGLTFVNRSADRLIRLIDDLLDISRIETRLIEFEMKPFSLAEIIDNGVKELILLVEERHQTLRRQLPDDLPLIEGDQDRVTQVVINLLSNAIKYTPEGGSIVIQAEEEDEQVHVKVSDNGVGIPPSALSKIFERFYQADPALSRKVGGGSGLGLTISKEIIEGHGGKIWAESEDGQGSTFHFTLPKEGNRGPSPRASRGRKEPDHKIKNPGELGTSHG